MCSPTILAPLLSTGGAAAAGTAAASSSTALAIQGVTAATKAFGAIAQANQQNKRYEQNAASALDAYFLKTTQANKRIMQEQIQAGQQKRDADLKSLKAQSTAIAAASASGVAGVDVDRLINDYERSEGLLTSRIEQRLEGMESQNEVQKLAFQSEAVQRINSIQPAQFAETLFNVVEPLAGFGLDYYGSQSRLASVGD